ncbi:MAG: carbon storage regulator [Planctomycetaceae bacterium]|nr:carbon storage regulator [Planctomycetaceae bacterium]MCA9111071.1 carbon storage regulator [Planctomycetaceae bacterium]
MIILERRANEDVVLDEQSTVTVISLSTDRVKLRLKVPSNVSIQRCEFPETLDCEAVLVSSGDTVLP